MKLIFGIIVVEGKDNPGKAAKVFMPYSPTARVFCVTYTNVYFYPKCKYIFTPNVSLIIVSLIFIMVVVVSGVVFSVYLGEYRF